MLFTARAHGRLVALLFCIMFAGADVVAADTAPEKAAEEESAEENGAEEVQVDLLPVDRERSSTPLKTLVGFHDRVSERVIKLGDRLDALFGTGDPGDLPAGTLVRIANVARFDDDGVAVDYRFRTRLALPRTERRFNLLLESDADETFEHRRDAGRRAEAEDARTPLRAGLQYLSRIAGDLDVDVDLGVRLPLEPFARARLRRSFSLGPWEMRVGQSLFWYERVGEGASTEILFEREVAPKRLLRSVSDVTYLQREEQFYYSQDFLYSRNLRRDRGVVYQLGIRGESEPSDRVQSYFVNLRARRSVGWEWLFVELRPELLFERENDFAMERRLFLTLEVVFGDLNMLD